MLGWGEMEQQHEGSGTPVKPIPSAWGSLAPRDPDSGQAHKSGPPQATPVPLAPRLPMCPLGAGLASTLQVNVGPLLSAAFRKHTKSPCSLILAILT